MLLLMLSGHRRRLVNCLPAIAAVFRYANLEQRPELSAPNDQRRCQQPSLSAAVDRTSSRPELGDRLRTERQPLAILAAEPTLLIVRQATEDRFSRRSIITTRDRARCAAIHRSSPALARMVSLECMRYQTLRANGD